MEQKLQLGLWILLWLVAVLVGIFTGGAVIWKFLPLQLPAVTPTLQELHQGLVAEATTEIISTPSPSKIISPTPVPTQSSAQPSVTSAPTAQPNVTSTSTPIIGLQNPDFTSGLQGWQTRGEVKVFSVSSTQFVRLASAENLDWLGAHALEQTFTIPLNHTALEFEYKIHTQETESGFDSPCLVVLINQKPVAWFAAADATEEWQQLSIPLPKTNQPITLSFIAGQTGDQTKATWIDLKNIKTSNTAPTQIAFEPLPSGTTLKFSQLSDPSFSLTADLPPQITHQPFIQELLIPDLGQQYALENNPWSPSNTFQPSFTSSDFHSQLSASYTTQNFQNFANQLTQLKEQNPTNPPKLWLTLKNNLNQVLQLLPLTY